MPLCCSQGHENPLSNRFCEKCGQPLPPNPSISEMRTINFAGRTPEPNSSYTHQKGGTQFIATPTPDSSWLRPWAVRVAGAGLVVLIGMGGWTVVNSVISSIQSRTESEPKASSSSLQKTQINLLFRRRQALGIKQRFFNVLVNEQFYETHPSLWGRSLKNKPEDANLRQEWYQMAEELLAQLEQAKLSATARGKLGSYSQQDYEIWKGKANRGQLGSYMIEQLEKQTDERFDQLFPQQRGEKRNFQAFGQIWYALLADKVTQLETK